MPLQSPKGHVRIFLDESLPIQLLIAQWLAYENVGPLRDYAIRLFSQFNIEPQAVSPTPEAQPSKNMLVEALSQRVLEVLHLMALGTTNQEPARQLFVAIVTIKAHATSIFRKLDVANRIEAVARA
jgi:ATP/maltotriose-dependent transcriptional regulator MalT